MPTSESTPPPPDFGGWTHTTVPTVDNTGSSVDLSASETVDGRGPSTSADSKSTDPGGTPGGAAAPREPETRDPVAVDCTSPTEPCTLNPDQPEPAPADPGYPAVTLADLASFRPATTTITVEPEGVGIAGRPANILAPAAAHTIDGTLLGYPVSVSFTPDTWRFDYGDGTTQTTATGGTPWSTARLPQFAPTDTTHSYTARGTYTITATVAYRPAVRFPDGIWRPVDGSVTTTATTGIRVYQATTILVAHTCLEDPTGPAC